MIGRLSLIVIVGVAAVALASALAAPAASDANRLSIRTGPGFKMKLTRAGREVDYLRRGKHTITIRDTSRSHNVALSRMVPVPGGVKQVLQRVLTSFAFVGTKTVTVTLRAGRYTVSCQRHSFPRSHLDMSDTFLVE